jgi:EAL domain-containing protein (putative c-di-GMP-specific phosphodiesterase class I)/GGDEF domain-containing protein
MMRPALIDALPDLAVLVRRDGVLLSYVGGRGVQPLCPASGCEGKSLESVWPAAVAELIKQLTRRAIAMREPSEAEFVDGELRYEARVSPQGPDRAICVIRSTLGEDCTDKSAPHDDTPATHLDRRGFLRRLKESMAIAALNERPLAIAIVRVDGVIDISRVIDSRVSEQVIGGAIRRIPQRSDCTATAEPPWYMGQFSENLLVVVLECSNRDLIEACVARLCQSLRDPIQFGDAIFHLTPYAGVAILGQDAASPKTLLDHARAAATEARRAASTRVFFFSDTLKLRSLARLDIARELRDAITNQDIRLRYAGRHDLATGRLVALCGYVQWIHPLRGEVRPAEFLSVAESTGLSALLSRSILARLRDDFGIFKSRIEPDVRISFGALRHHILNDDFLGDIRDCLAEGVLPAERLELRIAERSYVTQDVDLWRSLSAFGVQLIVDEVGRKMSSFDLLARAPLWGLQLDRSWAMALDYDPAAFKVCRAAISVAVALGLTPIATAVDDSRQRDALLGLGCRQGMGDLYSTIDAAILASCAPQCVGVKALGKAARPRA